MKRVRLYLTACLMLVASVTSALYANSEVSSTSQSGHATNTDSWQRVYVSYNPTKVSIDYDYANDLSGSGFSFGYTKGISIAKEFPLFLEAGANITYAFAKQDYDDLGLKEDVLECKTNLLSLNIPVSLAYKFTLSDGKVSIVPYLGVHFRGNLVGKQKFNLTIDTNQLGFSEDEFWREMESEYGVKQEINLFDKKDTGSKDYTGKRFQMGWQIGVGLNYNRLYVGIGYGRDFIEFCKKTKIGAGSISLGYNF